MNRCYPCVCARSAAVIVVAALVGLGSSPVGLAQTVTLDTSSGARAQVMDGFGTCRLKNEGEAAWWQSLYFDDLQCSILRLDLTPDLNPPYNGQNGTYNSPWYHNNPYFPGPQNNNVRAYTNAASYTNLYNGWSAPIAVMGPDIGHNQGYFNYTGEQARVAGLLAQMGAARSNQLGDFKLVGSFWSPVPWVKVSSGNSYGYGGTPMPATGTPFPFIWYNCFAGGKVDTSGALKNEFNDAALGGTGPTSALTQFARSTAAYIRGFQLTNNVRFYAISLQNELNFEVYYSSCTYPVSSDYIAVLKAVRAEFDKYPDLAPIKLMGPEDLMGDAWVMWGYSSAAHKNLQYLQNIAADPAAAAAMAFFCVHGYASDGVSAASANPTTWGWWANGWTTPPSAGLPANVKGFTYYGKKSWMTETSGENPAWLYPATGYPSDGAWGVALRIHQALTTGQQSAWIYWLMTDGGSAGAHNLTDSSLQASAPKYVAAKHYFKYIRPNAVRVAANVSGSTNLLVSAYLHETNQTMTAVLLNTRSNAISVTLNLPAQPANISVLRSFTSSQNSLWQSASLNVTNQTAQVTVPGYGIVTLYGVAPPRLSARPDTQGRINLSWTPAAVGFRVQTSTSVNPANWQLDASPITLSNGVASVSLTPAGGTTFYRLVLP